MIQLKGNQRLSAWNLHIYLLEMFIDRAISRKLFIESFSVARTSLQSTKKQNVNESDLKNRKSTHLLKRLRQQRAISSQVIFISHRQHIEFAFCL